MTFDLFMVWSNLCPVAVALLEDCCMAFANMQLSELCPMGTLFRLVTTEINTEK